MRFERELHVLLLKIWFVYPFDLALKGIDELTN